MIDRRTAIAATIGAALLAGRSEAQTAPPAVIGKSVPPALPEPEETIDLWPNGAPGMPTPPPVEIVTERSTDNGVNDRAAVGISRPRMVVFRPRVANGAAILIMPGGGYARVVVDKEGYELGRWLAARGFTAFVLFYRLPGDGWAAGPHVALSDAQRAMRLIRSRARDFAISPERVAAMGFSAGGHVCSDLVARFDAKTYAAVDKADTLSARPLVAALVYPVVSMRAPLAHAGSRDLLIGKTASSALEDAHSPNLHVQQNSPPSFIVAAEDDDTVPVENSLLMRAALKAAKVPVETHLFTHGGHGFGLRRVIGKPAEIWPELFLNWAATQGFA
uniref:alpha/beta hydrolase n=1 Tax=Sphingomonas bacterium TaxID=1895847 RepID=UPI0026234F2B|nr:alpha/beta hydrolase [Sphingomonas bacterium]